MNIPPNQSDFMYWINNQFEYCFLTGPEEVEGLASPPYSSVVFKLSKIEEVFLLLLLLVIIGEFLSAPAITLADAATLGKQFGFSLHLKVLERYWLLTDEKTH